MPNIDERLTDLRTTLAAGVSNADFSDVLERSTRRAHARHTRRSISGAAVLATVIGISALAHQRSHDDGRLGALLDRPQSPQVAQSIDWDEALVPGEACLSSGSIQLHHGRGHIAAGTKPREGHSPHLSARTLTLLDVTRSKGPVARTALTLICAVDGGTAAGDLRSSIAVYDAGGSAAPALGLLLAQHQPHAGRPNLLEVRHLGKDRVTVVEHIFTRTDPDCCPSRRMLTVWTDQDGTFRPGRSHRAGGH